MTHDTSPLRVGIIGCGKFARFYHVPLLLESKSAKLAAIFDTSPGPEVAGLAANSGIDLVSSIAELLAPGKCEAVIVSSPHALHVEHVTAVMAAGRHVLVDKPFVMSTAEAIEAIQAAGRANVVAGVAFNRRLDRGCIRARELLHAGALGALRHAETVQLGYPSSGWLVDPRLGGGGPFVGRGAHMADLIPWLTGQKPTAVSARIRPGSDGRVDHGGSITVEFEAFECHMTCIDSGLDMWDEVRLFGEQGLIELRRPLDAATGWDLVWHHERGNVVERISADREPGACTSNFISAVGDGNPIACSFGEALLSVQIIEAAYASAAASGHRIWIAG